MLRYGHHVEIRVSVANRQLHKIIWNTKTDRCHIDVCRPIYIAAECRGQTQQINHNARENHTVKLQIAHHHHQLFDVCAKQHYTETVCAPTKRHLTLLLLHATQSVFNAKRKRFGGATAANTIGRVVVVAAHR